LLKNATHLNIILLETLQMVTLAPSLKGCQMTQGVTNAQKLTGQRAKQGGFFNYE